jgi:hypothetical protein
MPNHKIVSNWSSQSWLNKRCTHSSHDTRVRGNGSEPGLVHGLTDQRLGEQRGIGGSGLLLSAQRLLEPPNFGLGHLLGFHGHHGGNHHVSGPE